MYEFKLIYGKEGYEKTKELREAVFMEEQGFSYDADDKDEISWHIAGYEKGLLMSSARMFQIGDGVFTIGRVAVKKEYRGQYVGDTLLRALEDKAVQLKGYLIEIGAQEQAVGFYEKEGYTKNGKEYDVEGVKHFEMIKDLTKPFRRCEGCKNKGRNE